MDDYVNQVVTLGKVVDKLFEKYGIDGEELAKYDEHYNLSEDPDIKRFMINNVMNVEVEDE
jgi:hypothetical protein